MLTEYHCGHVYVRRIGRLRMDDVEGVCDFRNSKKVVEGLIVGVMVVGMGLLMEGVVWG